MIRKARGQILLPALAVFMGGMMLFIGLAAWGLALIQQMRLERAAQAVALSAARAQAQILNTAASHNLAVNAFVNLSYAGYGAMQKAAEKPFRWWLLEQDWENKSNFVIGGFRGYPIGVGRVVAELNGIKRQSVWNFPPYLSPQLQLKDMFVVFLHKIIPVGGDWFDKVYYAREWHSEKRKAQPTHLMTWHLARGSQCASASARVYLDVQPGEKLQNGGFPRLDDDWIGQLGIQSFYPQFNAQLIPTRGDAWALEKWHRGI